MWPTPTPAPAVGPTKIIRFEGPLGLNPGQMIDEFVTVADFGVLPGGKRLHPNDLEFGPDGDLYVSTNKRSVHETLVFEGPFGANPGALAWVFARGEAGGGSDPIFDPFGLDFGPDGKLYVADTNSVYRFDPLGNFIEEFVPAASGLIGPARNLNFAPDGNLYVVDEANDQVLLFAGPAAANPGALIDVLTAPDGVVFGGFPRRQSHLLTRMNQGTTHISRRSFSRVGSFVPGPDRL